MSLDDRIYCLQQTLLPRQLQSLLVQADVYYLRDCDAKAMELVTQIEEQCKEQGIQIYKPEF